MLAESFASFNVRGSTLLARDAWVLSGASFYSSGDAAV
jgi:hypothetical protein